MFRQIKPGEKVIETVSFAVDNINRKYWLTFYDRKNNDIITKAYVDNAYIELSTNAKKKNEKVRTKKKSYKKDEDFMDLDF